MRDGREGTTPCPLLPAESFRNVLLSEIVIAEGDTHITSATCIYNKVQDNASGLQKRVFVRKTLQVGSTHTKFSTDTLS